MDELKHGTTHFITKFVSSRPHCSESCFLLQVSRTESQNRSIPFYLTVFGEGVMHVSIFSPELVSAIHTWCADLCFTQSLVFTYSQVPNERRDGVELYWLNTKKNVKKMYKQTCRSNWQELLQHKQHRREAPNQVSLHLPDSDSGELTK